MRQSLDVAFRSGAPEREQISTDKMLNQKINDVHYNPVKRGYVDKPEDWRYSSARDYLGESGLIAIQRII